MQSLSFQLDFKPLIPKQIGALAHAYAFRVAEHVLARARSNFNIIFQFYQNFKIDPDINIKGIRVSWTT